MRYYWYKILSYLCIYICIVYIYMYCIYIYIYVLYCIYIYICMYTYKCMCIYMCANIYIYDYYPYIIIYSIYEYYIIIHVYRCVYIDTNLHIVQNCNTNVSTHPWILYSALKYPVQEWKFCPLYDDVVWLSCRTLKKYQEVILPWKTAQENGSFIAVWPTKN